MRGNRRRRKIIIAYTLRIIVFLVLVGMLTLMTCGGIYIYQLFHKKTINGPVVNTFEGESAGSLNADDKEEMPEKENEIKSDDSRKDTDRKVRIVLDAGHGGEDGGTFSGNILEKDIALAVVLRMKSLLEEKDIEVILTRKEDEFLSLEDRTNIENRADADLFVSIHCNYYEDDSSIKGLECYYYEESKNGRLFAEALMDGLKKRGNLNVRYAKEDSFYVLKKTKSPAVLVELGFLSNYRECQKLSGEEYQEVLAEELVKSLEEIIASGLFL